MPVSSPTLASAAVTDAEVAVSVPTLQSALPDDGNTLAGLPQVWDQFLSAVSLVVNTLAGLPQVWDQFLSDSVASGEHTHRLTAGSGLPQVWDQFLSAVSLVVGQNVWTGSTLYSLWVQCPLLALIVDISLRTAWLVLSGSVVRNDTPTSDDGQRERDRWIVLSWNHC